MLYDIDWTRIIESTTFENLLRNYEEWEPKAQPKVLENATIQGCWDLGLSSKELNHTSQMVIFSIMKCTT